jgi:hypothetical protein
MDFLKKAMNSNKQGGSTNKDGSKGDITTSSMSAPTNAMPLIAHQVPKEL